MKYYLVLFILILSILYYFVNIENFSEEISTAQKNTSNTTNDTNTKGFYMSMTPNGMNMSLNWFGKKSNDSNDLSNWKCSSSMGDIRSIRKNSRGIVECASNDGANCIKHLNNVECINYNKLKNENLNPLTCDSGSSSKYDSEHWCKVGLNTLKDKNTLKLWTCNRTPDNNIRSIRKNSNDNIECASNDGQNCIIHNTIRKCEKYNKLKNESLNPYSCAPMNDTDNMTYWCASGYKELKSEY